MEVLYEAQGHWMMMDRFRRERERSKRYTYGDQWGDLIDTPEGRMREEDWLRAQGLIPLKNNLIRRLVKSVLGVFRSQMTEPTCVARDRKEQAISETMSTILQANMTRNASSVIRSKMLEEYLISGLVCCRKWFGDRRGMVDCWTDVIDPNNFFIDTRIRDPRGWDTQIIGEIHDVSYDEILSQFARCPEDVELLGRIYGPQRLRGDELLSTWQDFGYNLPGSDVSFLEPADPGVCRMIEVWRLESRPRYRCHDRLKGEAYKIDLEDWPEIEAENAARLQTASQYGIPAEEVQLIEAEFAVERIWHYYFLSPEGDILKEGDTPYAHDSHPYVFSAYPLIDGEIHSFVADVIDQQRFVNRLIALNDWVIRNSAKGVLLFPAEAIPEGWDLRDIGEVWAKPNGIIPFKAKNLQQGMTPHQVSANLTNIGTNEMLATQMRLLEEESGVNGALQGKPGFSGMSASLYAQQTQNATTTLLDLLDGFAAFEQEGAYKDVKNIQQFYDDDRIIDIAGEDSSRPVPDPDQIRSIEFDLSIVPSQATPAYRAITNDWLMQIFQSGQIPLKTMLEVGSFPFADKLLQSLAAEEKAQQQAQAQQQAEAIQAQAALQQQTAQSAQPQSTDQSADQPPALQQPPAIDPAVLQQSPQ